MRTELNKKRDAVKVALVVEIVRTLGIAFVLTLFTTGVFYLLSPTSFIFPLLLQGEYLTAFLYTAKVYGFYLAMILISKGKVIWESISLLNESRKLK